jgi:hypothetical protein
MAGIRLGNTAELWRDPELGLRVDDDHSNEPDGDDATALLGAKLITASHIARALDAPCERCRRAAAAGRPRRECSGIGCSRWSIRRARRWMRRSQCPQRSGAPPCPARSGGTCACQIGVQLWPGGAWITTLSRLRERFPDVADLVLVHQEDG